MANATDYGNRALALPVALPAGATGLSAAVQLNGLLLVGLIVPAGWLAASVTLQGSVDGATWYNVYDDTGTEVTLAVAASRFVALAPATFAAFPYVRLRSGTAALPVNQTGSPTLTLIARPA